MTISTIHPQAAAPTAPLVRSVAARPDERRRGDDLAAMADAVRSEWIKLRTLRSTPAILGLTVIIGVLLSWILATFVQTDPDTGLPFTVGETFIFSTWLTTLLAIVMGTLLFTSEVHHSTLAINVVARPARWIPVVAKTAVGAGLGVVMGLAGMAAGLAGAVVSGLDAGDTSGMLTTALWGLLLTGLAPVFGLGVGLIVRHSPVAITAVLVWALVIENLILGFAPPTWTRFMPFSAANGLLGIEAAGDSPATAAVELSRLADAFLFGGYALAGLLAGITLLHRRDVA